MVAARTRHIDGTDQLELTTRVTLSVDGNTAMTQGINLPLVVNAAIQACLAEVDLMLRHRTMIEGSDARPIGGRRQLPNRAA